MAFVIRHIRRSLGWILVIMGAIFLPLPIPLGLPFLIIGGALIVSDSEAAQRVVRVWRRRYRRIDGHIYRVAPRMPGFVRSIIDKTEPRPLRRANGLRAAAAPVPAPAVQPEGEGPRPAPPREAAE
ncbi:MAG: hypothetical protein HXY25_00900 [Alphaproteobacteria bacterium]|nr:hypothetical protein [Alphaproteobacteria bacterium]